MAPPSTAETSPSISPARKKTGLLAAVAAAVAAAGAAHAGILAAAAAADAGNVTNFPPFPGRGGALQECRPCSLSDKGRCHRRTVRTVSSDATFKKLELK